MTESRDRQYQEKSEKTSNPCLASSASSAHILLFVRSTFCSDLCISYTLTHYKYLLPCNLYLIYVDSWVPSLRNSFTPIMTYSLCPTLSNSCTITHSPLLYASHIHLPPKSPWYPLSSFSLTTYRYNIVLSIVRKCMNNLKLKPTQEYSFSFKRRWKTINTGLYKCIK